MCLCDGPRQLLVKGVRNGEGGWGWLRGWGGLHVFVDNFNENINLNNLKENVSSVSSSLDVRIKVSKFLVRDGS